MEGTPDVGVWRIRRPRLLLGKAALPLLSRPLFPRRGNPGSERLAPVHDSKKNKKKLAGWLAPYWLTHFPKKDSRPP